MSNYAIETEINFHNPDEKESFLVSPNLDCYDGSINLIIRSGNQKADFFIANDLISHFSLALSKALKDYEKPLGFDIVHRLYNFEDCENEENIVFQGTHDGIVIKTDDHEASIEWYGNQFCLVSPYLIEKLIQSLNSKVK